MRLAASRVSRDQIERVDTTLDEPLTAKQEHHGKHQSKGSRRDLQRHLKLSIRGGGGKYRSSRYPNRKSSLPHARPFRPPFLSSSQRGKPFSVPVGNKWQSSLLMRSQGPNGLSHWRIDMKKTMMAAVILTVFAAPAFAQSFYVVQDVKTKKCTVTETKPTSTDVTVVNGDTVYKTKAEAESGMKTVKVCTSN
jgi:hypothetical protein